MVEFSVWANFIHLFDLSYQLEKQVQYNVAEQYTNQEMVIIPEYLSSTPFLIEFESLNLYFILGIVKPLFDLLILSPLVIIFSVL